VGECEECNEIYSVSGTNSDFAWNTVPANMLYQDMNGRKQFLQWFIPTK